MSITHFGRLLLLPLSAILLSACAFDRVSEVELPSDLKLRLHEQVESLEKETGLILRRPYQVRTVRAQFVDDKGHAGVRSPSGKNSLGWVEIGQPYQVTFPVMEGKTIPTRIIRHEALHLILLSNGVDGHPEDYSHLTWGWNP